MSRYQQRTCNGKVIPLVASRDKSIRGTDEQENGGTSTSRGGERGKTARKVTGNMRWYSRCDDSSISNGRIDPCLARHTHKDQIRSFLNPLIVSPQTMSTILWKTAVSVIQLEPQLIRDLTHLKAHVECTYCCLTEYGTSAPEENAARSRIDLERRGDKPKRHNLCASVVLL